METSSGTSVEIIKLILALITDNIWPLILIIFLVICRDSVSDLIKRITNFRFRKGKTEFGIEAPPLVVSQGDTGLKSIDEKPATKDFKDTEIAEKEEKKSEWFADMNQAFIEGRIDDAKNIFSSYYEKEPDQEEKEQNEAYFLYNLYTKGSDKKAIDRLERLAQSVSSEESKMSALVWLSFCYSDSNDHEKQINLWNTALQDIKGSHHKTQCIEYLSYALKADGRSQEGLSLLENRLQEVSSDEEKIAIYKAIAAMEKDLGNGLMNALSMEKVVELKPDDKENLFDAAYAQSQAEMRSLSICNYRTLLKLESNNSMAINNLGVCAAEYDLDTKAVEYYSEARNKGNTLAMANLGYKFLDAGFYQDAEEIAKEALKNESPHKNVYSLLSRIDE